MSIGFDVGTFSLICAKRNKKEIEFNKGLNSFIEIPLENRFLFNMMKNSGVPLIERDNIGYVLGEAAVNMAYTLASLELKRPMSNGCVNPKEKSAFEILQIMIHSLVGEIENDNEKLYYCVPANAVNTETDAEYHQKIIHSIFKSYESETGYKLDPHPINEALAIVYAEMEKKAYTGIGISFGGGMCNICYAMYGNPVFQFAIVNSGDWIDKQAAKATGESTTVINKEKMGVDLSKEPSNMLERAINTQYRIMIEKTIQGIKEGLSNAKTNVRSAGAVDVVVAGGTSSIAGFDVLFKEAMKNANLSVEIGNVTRAENPTYTIAKGCLIAAENSN